jgi:NAD(P) transhydrogenase
MEEAIVSAVYMVCAILFILSLGGLSNQETAKRGNYYGIIAMSLAILATFFLDDFENNYSKFLPAFVIGGFIGLVMALKVEMISMPQLVAALHSFVGLGATLVGISKFLNPGDKGFELQEQIETFVGVFIGGLTFTGSVVAWGKLQGVIRSNPLIILGWGRHLINAMVLSACIALGVMFCVWDNQFDKQFACLAVMTCLSFFIGWHLVMAIGGADMPVVVSMLNSYSGWATSANGFLLENQLLIITGALVGSSGAILSYIMCKAMNRSFFSVIMGGFGQGTSSAASTTQASGVEAISTNKAEFVKELQAARDVIIVPGYGMAVAKCQHDVSLLTTLLKKSGKNVRFCIHPVAGRLPGHMNVLLAEADVSYDIVLEMEEINHEFSRCDMVLVIGANDIVNPDALDNPASPIAGMPVCEVWKSKRVVVFKRGSGTGYAGIENPLFIKPNTRMYYGNADKSIKEILNCMTEDKGFSDLNVSEIKASKAEEVEEIIKESDIPEPLAVIGVPKECYPLERRVAITPRTVKRFRKLGYSVMIETGAGKPAGFNDAAYEAQGARIVDQWTVWRKADVILKVRKPEYNPTLNCHEIEMLGRSKILVSYIYPAQNEELLASIATKHPSLTVLAMDCVPRITRAQKLDSLSSMANLGGYRAVIEAVSHFQRCPKAQITAAGKVPPAKAFIIGAGVAGLAAIGYLKSMGCIVRAFDTRPAAREQAESLGAEFIEVKVTEDGNGVGGYAKEMSPEYIKAQLEMTLNQAKEVDIIITTALIPGKKAPILITDEIVRAMQPGSVIVDMAAEMGGNCSLTRKDEAYYDEESGVTIIGFTDLISRIAPQSSDLYSTNLWHLLDEIGGAKNLKVNMSDEVQGQMTVVNEGKVTWVPLHLRPAPQAQPVAKPAELQITPTATMSASMHSNTSSHTPGCCGNVCWLFGVAGLLGLFVLIAVGTEHKFMNLFLSFVLAIFVGYMVIWNVSSSLHTPLMSVTNAISGIIVIGSMLELKARHGYLIDEGSATGLVAAFFASINVVGGFLVTQRMLMMFRKG